MSETFDVFLSHNSKDKPAVRELGLTLRTRGLKVWLDEWELVPGRPWLDALERVIETIECAVVLVSKDGLGPWEAPEMRACLSEFVSRGLPVIPVLLPGAPDRPTLPLLLRQFTWVDLRSGLTEEGIDRLLWGITGRKPEVPLAVVKHQLVAVPGAKQLSTTGQHSIEPLIITDSKPESGLLRVAEPKSAAAPATKTLAASGQLFTEPLTDVHPGKNPDSLLAVADPLPAAAQVLEEKPAPDQSFTDPLTGIHFLWIPDGRFQMGSTAYPDERPVHWVRISPFWLAETPVTNRQYAVFLEKKGAREPAHWRDNRFSALEQPVVGVNWDDTQEFCTWLSKASGRHILLPSEAQWEFAARSTDGRKYPWGNEPPDETRACFSLDVQKGQTASAGSFPAGCGPYGNLDQAGNVWEWCRDEWDENAYLKLEHTAEAVDPILDRKYAERRVLRGGGWFYPAESLRAAYRLRYPTRDRSMVVGFRVAAVPPEYMIP